MLQHTPNVQQTLRDGPDANNHLQNATDQTTKLPQLKLC